MLLLGGGRRMLDGTAVELLLLWTIGVALLDQGQILLEALHFLDEAPLLLQLLLSLHELLLLGCQLLAKVLVLGGELEGRQEIGVVLLILSVLSTGAAGFWRITGVGVISLIMGPGSTSSLLVFVACGLPAFREVARLLLL